MTRKAKSQFTAEQEVIIDKMADDLSDGVLDLEYPFLAATPIGPLDQSVRVFLKVVIERKMKIVREIQAILDAANPRSLNAEQQNAIKWQERIYRDLGGAVRAVEPFGGALHTFLREVESRALKRRRSGAPATCH